MDNEEIKHITIGAHDYHGVRVAEGGPGYIELRDIGTGAPVGRITCRGSEQEMELTTFGATLPRAVVEWLLAKADEALA